MLLKLNGNKGRWYAKRKSWVYTPELPAYFTEWLGGYLTLLPFLTTDEKEEIGSYQVFPCREIFLYLHN